ncbi:hypothetical protein CC78DRAFT_578773 [Lojkania enalia]|uniref:Uncharacterized protein n=1 Tax=Lojkania enalia TaxID=147567 RepID=A0A9P4KDM7_9PLEO|nr:hypothetical protein CC78DRAFT_578773 [Didymosphaeria enalia]
MATITINDLPRETFDKVCRNLLEYEYPTTERFPTLTLASKRGILSARTVWAGLRECSPLRELFVKVLEETPFFTIGTRMPDLEAVSQSEYAKLMATLSLCGLILKAEGIGRPSGFYTYLAVVLEQFPRIKHLRYYPVTKRYFDGCWSTQTRFRWGRAEYYCTLAGEPARAYSPGMKRCGDNDIVVFCQACAKAGLELESVTVPLFGNRGLWCAVQPYATPSSIKRLSVNLTGFGERSLGIRSNAIIQLWIAGLPQLEFLEIAVARKAEETTVTPTHITGFSGFRKLTTVKEFRLLTDSTYFFQESDIIDNLRWFPMLKRLSLGYIQLMNGTWDSLVWRLLPLNLDALWVLNPITIERIPPDRVRRHDESHQGKWPVARSCRWIHARVPRDHAIYPAGSDFDYSGFSIFEQDRE